MHLADNYAAEDLVDNFLADIVVDVLPLFAGVHQTAVLKDLKMVGYGRLRSFELGTNIRDVPLMLGEHLEYILARFIRKRLEYPYKVVVVHSILLIKPTTGSRGKGQDILEAYNLKTDNKSSLFP
jgi:hypothetical protein